MLSRDVVCCLVVLIDRRFVLFYLLVFLAIPFYFRRCGMHISTVANSLLLILFMYRRRRDELESMPKGVGNPVFDTDEGQQPLEDVNLV